MTSLRLSGIIGCRWRQAYQRPLNRVIGTIAIRELCPTLTKVDSQGGSSTKHVAKVLDVPRGAVVVKGRRTVKLLNFLDDSPLKPHRNICDVFRHADQIGEILAEPHWQVVYSILRSNRCRHVGLHGIRKHGLQRIEITIEVATRRQKLIKVHEEHAYSDRISQDFHGQKAAKDPSIGLSEIYCFLMLLLRDQLRFFRDLCRPLGCSVGRHRDTECRPGSQQPCKDRRPIRDVPPIRSLRTYQAHLTSPVRFEAILP